MRASTGVAIAEVERIGRPVALGWFFAIIIAFVRIARAEEFEPAWTWNADRRIEWCESVIGDDPSALLICDADGHIELLNIITGKSRLDGPIDARRGTRFAGAANAVAYAVDRDRAYAISVTDTDEKDRPRDRLLWRVGDGPDPLERGKGDPEFLTSVLAAAATNAGLLVVRSDGATAELRRQDGSPRWRLDLPRGADAKIRVDGDTAAIVFKVKSAAHVAFINLKDDAPQPAVKKLGDTWPMWCELTGEGLLAAWPARLFLCPASGEAQRLKLQVKSRFSAAALDVFRPERLRRRDNEPATPPQRVLALIDGENAVSGHYLLSEKPAWHGDPPEARRTRWSRLRVEGRLAIVSDESGRVAAFDVVDGDLRGLYVGADGERALGTGATDSALYSLRSASSQGLGARVQLVRTPLFQAGGWRADRARTGQASFDLGPAIVPRDVLWPRGRLVVVEERRIRTYVLP